MIRELLPAATMAMFFGGVMMFFGMPEYPLLSHGFAYVAGVLSCVTARWWSS